jgi:hypothetical protein
MPAVPAAFLARISHERRDLVFGGGLPGVLDFEPDTEAVALSVTSVDVNADSPAEQKFGIAPKPPRLSSSDALAGVAPNLAVGSALLARCKRHSA